MSSIGSIVDIDFPVQDTRIEKLKERRTRPTLERKLRNTYDERMKISENYFKQMDQFLSNPQNKEKVYEPVKPSPDQYAVPLAERILDFEKDLRKRVSTKSAAFLEKEFSLKTPEKLRLINKDKRMKILSLSTLLYNESVDLNDTIRNIKLEQEELVARLNNTMQYPDLPTSGRATIDATGSNLTEYVTPQQIENLRMYMNYVMNNSESLSPEVLSEANKNKIFEVLIEYNKKHGENPLVKMGIIDTKNLTQSLESQIINSDIKIKEELAKGYQWLLYCLERKEFELKNKLERLLKDYNKKDMILYQMKDHKNDLEDIDYQNELILENEIKIEDIISISEQIRNTVRNLDEENTDIAYMDNPNFWVKDIETAKLTERNIDLTKMKIPRRDHKLDLHKLKNEAPVLNKYKDEELRIIIEKAQKMRENTDLPFDQLYHREKSLIDNVVMAEKELKEAITQMEKNLEKLDDSMNNVYDPDLDILIRNRQRIAPAKSDDNADSLFNIEKQSKASLMNPIDELLDGISNDYLEKVNEFVKDKFHEENKGYCFITFSHTDEAKSSLLDSDKMYLENQQLSVELKDDLDHKDFNTAYVKARTEADVKILYKKEKLEEARKKLEDFEKNFDENLPKTHKLNQMKKAAQDAIEGNLTYDRDEFPRSELEIRRLKENLRSFEDRTGIDVTPLYEDNQSEIERINRHRKAFDTYKSYSFLKAGLQKTKYEDKLTGGTSEQTDQYKFPNSSEVAKVFISNDYKFRLLDEGEEDTTPGRKFGFSKKKFLETYLGKDSNRVPVAYFDDRKIYSFNDEMKRTYSYDKLSNVSGYQKVQKEQIEHLNKDSRQAKELRNYKKEEEHSRAYKRLVSGQDPIEFVEKDPHNPFVDDTNINDRIPQYIKNMSSRTEEGKRKWRVQNLRKAIKNEEMDHSFEYVKKLKDKIKKEEMKKDIKPSEKWAPQEESEEEDGVTQKYKEKIYNEYLDNEDNDSIQNSQIKRKEFTKAYLNELRKNVDEIPEEAKNLQLNKKQLSYLNELQKRRSIIKDKEDKQKYKEYLEELNGERADPLKTDLSFKEKFMIKYKQYYNIEESKTQPPKVPKQQRDENVEFLYRREYAKDHPENIKQIDTEETLEFKRANIQAKSQKDFKEYVKQNIETSRFSDREIKEDFIRALKRGTLSEGLDEREQKISTSVSDKDLASIAYDDQPEHQDIYNEYKLQSKLDLDQKHAESVEQREAKFLEAVQRETKQSSLDQNRTLQDFEDYKKLQQLRKEYETEPEEAKAKPQMSHRDWLAKLWSGKLTAKEYEETMLHIDNSQDENGKETKYYNVNKTPMRGQEKYITDNDQQRLNRERLEKFRRTLIMNGQLNEEESHEYMKKFMEHLDRCEELDNTPTFKLIGTEMFNQFMTIQRGEHAREYYFDPTQGVSLEEHVSAIKMQAGVEVQTRVDKDGFTIVKKTMKKQYKYNINRILDNSPKQVEFELNNTIDKIVTEEMNKRGISKLSEEVLVDILSCLRLPKDNPKSLKNSTTYNKLGALSMYHKGYVDDVELFKDEV